MYWNIGKLIVEYQGNNERAKYGDRLIKRLSIELTKEYGSGFTKFNLKRCDAVAPIELVTLCLDNYY